MTKRETSIDVMRGMAILGMVLSGTISRNPDLPAWLFHAQIPPPDFIFNPNLPGITWVDLVFPLFLFAMGMAIPFSLNKLIENEIQKKIIIAKILFRSFKLFFFAVMLGHLSPFHYPQELGWLRYLLGMTAFAGFFLAFSKFPHLKRYETSLNMAGYIVLIILLFVRTQALALPFSIHSNDIIILVLSNMALFGCLIWIFTRENLYMRVGILALFFAFRLTHSIDGSWNNFIWNFTLLKWIAVSFPAISDALLSKGIDLTRTVFYNPEFLKYLLILIPGTIAGDLVYAGIREKVSIGKNPGERVFVYISVLIILNIVLNLWGLFGRHINFVWSMNIASIFLLFWLAQNGKFRHLSRTRQILYWSIFWLVLGLVFEAWEGGIKKDHATYSYFFTTSGLAGLLILMLKILIPVFQPGKISGFIGLTGMNPMLGYIAVAYCIIPVFYFVQIIPWMDQWHTQFAWAGFLRGMILTALMVVLTVISVQKKYFWKT